MFSSQGLKVGLRAAAKGAFRATVKESMEQAVEVVGKKAFKSITTKGVTKAIRTNVKKWNKFVYRQVIGDNVDFLKGTFSLGKTLLLSPDTVVKGFKTELRKLKHAFRKFDDVSYSEVRFFSGTRTGGRYFDDAANPSGFRRLNEAPAVRCKRAAASNCGAQWTGTYHQPVSKFIGFW